MMVVCSLKRVDGVYVTPARESSVPPPAAGASGALPARSSSPPPFLDILVLVLVCLRWRAGASPGFPGCNKAQRGGYGHHRLPHAAKLQTDVGNLRWAARRPLPGCAGPGG